MKTHYFKAILLIGALVLGMGACKKNFSPSTAIDEKDALTTPGDIATATVGNYGGLRSNDYIRSGHFLAEYPSDEVAQGEPSSNDLTNCYRYTHLTTSDHANRFWGRCYYVIGGINKIIAAIPDDASKELLQLKGENLYLRAMLHFNLVRIFGRPYPQNNGDNPGVPIINETLTYEQTLTVSRSKVSEVYAFVIADLQRAAALMTIKKANIYASTQVVNALLARVYLYMGDNNKAIEFANKVINSNDYSLLQGAAYTSAPKNVPENNKEIIFAIRYTTTQDAGQSSIGAMYFSGDATGATLDKGNNGHGQMYASKKYWDSLQLNPTDLRISFISPHRKIVNGVSVLQFNTGSTPPVPMYYVNKYTLQEGIIRLSSPVYLRLAEMYLIRAEANAKLGNDQLALNDVNLLRTRAGLTGAALHTLASIAASGKSALDVVLDERWLELAFEGHRIYDLFRNGRPMIRNYPGLHALNVSPANVNQTVLATDNRAIFFIPENEIAKNPNLTQNP